MNFLTSAIYFLLIQVQSVTMTVSPSQLHPGSPFLLNISGLVNDTGYKVVFDNRTVPVMGNGKAQILLGIDLEHRGGTDQIALYEQGKASPVTVTTIQVHKYNYPSQYITLPKYYVELSPDELKRAEKEQKELDQIFANNTTKPMWNGDFILPVNGIITTPFGVKRFLNGEPRAPHTGIDIAAKSGTPVVATNNGIVCFIGSLFFGGNSIIIDHGQGIYSMYFHLEKYAVNKGDYVKKGQVIGYVGATGRVTGPSLHFGVRVVDNKIDPELLFSLTRKMQ
ncbi:MAG: M23 family metallopeptidase [bacterium]